VYVGNVYGKDKCFFILSPVAGSGTVHRFEATVGLTKANVDVEVVAGEPVELRISESATDVFVSFLFDMGCLDGVTDDPGRM
jgi:hypothetical protein